MPLPPAAGAPRFSCNLVVEPQRQAFTTQLPISRGHDDELNMDVFINWSGKQSQQVADALHRYLPKMINAVEPWLSSADIEAGARWGSDIASKLGKSRVGIICLTPNNLGAVWIHFEARALAKALRNTFVCPYLLGIEPSDVKGPLSQFQAIQADQPGTRRLLETLNSALEATTPEKLKTSAPPSTCGGQSSGRHSTPSQRMKRPRKGAATETYSKNC